MNIFYKLYCRTYELFFKIGLPFLPYKDPKIIDRLIDIVQVLDKEKKRKPLIVTDETIYNLGLVKPLEDSLNNSNINYIIFNKVMANPTTDIVEEALKVFINNKCDCLIAFGGGSVLDCAKGIGARFVRPNKSLNQLKGILHVRKKIPLLIAIPTTAGTGSETTLACVLIDSKTHHKYAINDFPLIPRYAVLDEEVTMSLPDFVVATTGMDALTHAIESYIGKSGNKKTRKDALEAIKLIFENLEESYFNKTRIARKNMLLASFKAGKSFSKAYVGYVHALAHALGGKYNVAHGKANAILLPIVLRKYDKAIYKKMYQIALYCNLIEKNCTYKDAFNLIVSKIEEMNKKFNIPNKIEMKYQDLDEMINYAYKEAHPLYPVPKLLDKKALKELYIEVGDFNE